MEQIPDYADVMTLDEFVEAVKQGVFVNDDGSGYYATATEMSDVPAVPSEIRKGLLQPGFTHVAWFNK